MVTAERNTDVGDISGKKEPLIAHRAEDGNKVLRPHYRPDARTRPVVFDVIEDAISYLNLNWHRFSILMETASPGTTYRWRRGNVTPAYKYLLKTLHFVVLEGFRKDRVIGEILTPVRRLLMTRLNNAEKGTTFTVEPTVQLPPYLHGTWIKTAKIGWENKEIGIMRLPDQLLTEDRMVKVIAEVFADG